MEGAAKPKYSKWTRLRSQNLHSLSNLGQMPLLGEIAHLPLQGRVRPQNVRFRLEAVDLAILALGAVSGSE